MMNSIKQISDKKWETHFATLELDENNIIHVSGKEGADVTKSDFEVLREWMEKLNLNKILILADRSQSYSHTFEAQRFISKSKEITAVALYVTSSMSKGLAELAKDIYIKNFPVRVFTDKEEALNWLREFL